MKQFLVEGGIEYLQFCPKAPDVDILDSHLIPAQCDGHNYFASVRLYVEAPEETRAAWKALDKLKSVYPWPQWVNDPLVQLIARAGDVPEGPPLPGFERALRGIRETVGEGESITLTAGDKSVTLTGRKEATR